MADQIKNPARSALSEPRDIVFQHARSCFDPPALMPEDQVRVPQRHAGQLGQSDQIEVVGVVESPGGDRDPAPHAARQCAPDATGQLIDRLAGLHGDPCLWVIAVTIGASRSSALAVARLERMSRARPADRPAALGQDSLLVRGAPLALQRRRRSRRDRRRSTDRSIARRTGRGTPVPRAVLVVMPLGMNPHDHPRPAFESQGEQAVGLRRPRRGSPYRWQTLRSSASHSGRQPAERASTE